MDDFPDDLKKRVAEPRLTGEEVAELRRRRPAVRASLACEGMYLTAEEEKLFDAMDAEGLTADQSAARIIEYCRARRHAKQQARS